MTGGVVSAYHPAVRPLQRALEALVGEQIELDDGRPSWRWWTTLAIRLEATAQPPIAGWALATFPLRLGHRRHVVHLIMRGPSAFYGWELRWCDDSRGLRVEVLG